MHNYNIIEKPLVSIIIPCFNHGQYLAEAIESVRVQSYTNIEIIVVDDGSTDNTKEVASIYTDVIYVYQENKGLPAARNKGIIHSNGQFLVFLDADDWLLPNALTTNLELFSSHANAAFISGGYKLMYVPTNEVWDVKREVTTNHYYQFLQENYIGMHATVMFARWIFENYKYDETLNACEDYDLYLRISKKNAVAHHTDVLAVYRIHTDNMSANYVLMLDAALKVFHKQKKVATSHLEKSYILKGKAHFKQFYTQKIYEKLSNYYEMDRPFSLSELYTLWRYNKPLYKQYLAKTQTHTGKLLGLAQQAVWNKMKSYFKLV